LEQSPEKQQQTPRYEKTGIYIDQMLVSSGGKKYAVPVYYVTEGDPAVQVNRTFEISFNNFNNQLQISNSGNGILLWDIVSMPDWMNVNMQQFDAMSLMLGKDASAFIPFNFDAQKSIQGELKGEIILKTNDKKNELIRISVSVSLGNPKLFFLTDYLEFASSETTKNYGVFNQGDGILIWNFEGMPDWLTVSPSNGMYLPYSSDGNVTFTCDRSKLKPGLNSARFYLKSNDPEKTFIPIHVTVRVAGINENVRILEGNLIEAAFNKNSNTLYYVTSQPDKLVAYNVNTKRISHELTLSKAPTCLGITEDFTQAVIGHGGMISIINITDFSFIKTFETNYTVYDAEWADIDWFCFTKTNNSANYLLWKNIKTDDTYQTSTVNNFFGTADLKKIPGQPYLAGARKDISPTGLFVFDISTKTLKSYTHETMGNLWFFNEGKSAVTGYSYIVRTSSIISATGNFITPTPTIGELKENEFRYPSWWIDFSPLRHSIWAIKSFHANTYFQPQYATIYEFEDNDYTLVKTYYYDNYFQPDAQSAPYEVEARYVFANNEGTELSVLRKGKDNNVWSIEFIPVQ
jgi:hypothetical protein